MQLAFVVAYVAVFVVGLVLEGINLRHLRQAGGRVPLELEGVVEQEQLAKIAAYSRDKARFAMLQHGLNGVVLGAVVFGGGLGTYDRFITGLGLSFVGSSVVFALGALVLGALGALPFSAYRSFVIEARHGFNRSSARLFATDWLKGTLLSLLFAALLVAVAAWLLRAAPDSWWLWVWLALMTFEVAILFATPYVIEPLFFKMEPLPANALLAGVQELAQRAGVRVGRVLKVDASRRSAHSNAYFTGIGRVKRVVLFDTLLAQMTDAEVLAVLAHELGHWKKHHVRVRVIFGFALSLVLCYVAFRVLSAPWVPALVGLPEASVAARAVVLGVLSSLLTFPLTPLSAAWSRKHEREADRFAVELSGRARELASALAKLTRDNLGNLHPHPLYAAFYYSHPPVTERIRTLRAMATA